MVGHLMLFHPALVRLKELICEGELGKILYLYFRRVNLGKIRKNENALLSFAPHDISMALYLLDSEPTMVCARGEAYVQPDVEDVVFLNMSFPDRVMVQIHVSWLDLLEMRNVDVRVPQEILEFSE